MKLNLIADKVTIRGPKIDGSLIVSFELGEYQKQNFAELIKGINFNQVINLTIEQEEKHASFEN